jgi:hypothetical protein
MAAVVYKWLLFSGFWLAGLRSNIVSTETSPFAKHPFYISVTEITQNTTDKTLEVSCKVFADDLEQIIEKTNNVQLDISADKDKTSFDKFIPAYIAKHLSVSVDGKASALSYVGFEKEKESAFCYFEIKNITSPKKIDVTNSLLHDFINEEINLIHVTINGKRQSTKLDYPSTNASFSF